MPYVLSIASYTYVPVYMLQFQSNGTSVHVLSYVQTDPLCVVFLMDFYSFLKMLLKYHLSWSRPSPSLPTV